MSQSGNVAEQWNKNGCQTNQNDENEQQFNEGQTMTVTIRVSKSFHFFVSV